MRTSLLTLEAVKRHVISFLAFVVMVGIPATYTSDALAILITQSYTGTLQHDTNSDPDTIGLDGATFEWIATFDSTATRTVAGGNNDQFTALSISLTITYPSPPAIETYSPSDLLVVEVTSGDFYDFSGGYLIGSEPLRMGALGVPLWFTGAISPTNTFTPFQTSDLTRVDPWFSLRIQPCDDPDGELGFGGICPTQALYNVQSAAASFTVPEPTALLLMGLGLAGLGFARRRRLNS